MDEGLATLISMDFDETSALTALNEAGGDINLAVSLLVEDKHVDTRPQTQSQPQQFSVESLMQNLVSPRDKNQNTLTMEEPTEEEFLEDKKDSAADGNIYNIPYEPFTHEKHMLNVHLPKNISKSGGKKLPVVLHVHGGGWIRGDRNAAFYGAPFMGQAFADRGYVSVTCSYRTGHAFPAAPEDVANAVAWVYNFIEEYGGDKNKIFLSGHSAGGHLVSLISSNPKFLAAVKVPKKVVKGVISISGIYTISNPLSPGRNDIFNVMFRSVYVNRTFTNNPLVWDAASPITHVQNSNSDSLPPFCIFNAASDFGLDYDGKKLFGLLTEKNVPVTYRVVPNTDHASVTRSHVVADLSKQFIEEQLFQLEQQNNSELQKEKEHKKTDADL